MAGRQARNAGVIHVRLYYHRMVLVGLQLWSAIVFGVFLLWLAFILIEYIMN
jgi:hypothetical protein